MKNLVDFSDILFRFSSNNVKINGSFTIPMDGISPFIYKAILCTPTVVDHEFNEISVTAKNIATLLTDHDLKKNMGITTHQRALKFYDWNLIVEKYEDFLSEHSINSHKIGTL